MSHDQLHSHVYQLPLPSWFQEKKKKSILLLLFYNKGKGKEVAVMVPER